METMTPLLGKHPWIAVVPSLAPWNTFGDLVSSLLSCCHSKSISYLPEHKNKQGIWVMANPLNRYFVLLQAVIKYVATQQRHTEQHLSHHVFYFISFLCKQLTFSSGHEIWKRLLYCFKGFPPQLSWEGGFWNLRGKVDRNTGRQLLRSTFC